jgi:hypothetical protein
MWSFFIMKCISWPRDNVGLSRGFLEDTVHRL